MAREENSIVKAIQTWLALKRIRAWRVNTGGVPARGGRFKRNVAAGFPDLVCCCCGMFIAIEVKTPTGRQQPSQKLFQQELEAAGGVYLLCRSLADVEAFFSNQMTAKRFEAKAVTG